MTTFAYGAIPQGLLSCPRAAGTEYPDCSETALESTRKHLLSTMYVSNTYRYKSGAIPALKVLCPVTKTLVSFVSVHRALQPSLPIIFLFLLFN